MDQTGLETMGPLRVSSLARVQIKQMIKEGKIIEVSPGVFKPSWWYAMDLELKRRFKKEG